MREWRHHVDEELRTIERDERDERRRQEEAHNENRETLRRIEMELSRYRGMVGGVMLVATGIGAVLLFFKDWILIKIGLKGDS